jgi:hypothetical protein
MVFFMKTITYGQLRDVLDEMIKSGARKANDPLYLNGQYWAEIVDCKFPAGKGHFGVDLTKHKVVARGRVEKKMPPPDRIRLV